VFAALVSHEKEILQRIRSFLDSLIEK